jgi:hypothetical protein
MIGRKIRGTVRAQRGPFWVIDCQNVETHLQVHHLIARQIPAAMREIGTDVVLVFQKVGRNSEWAALS